MKKILLAVFILVPALIAALIFALPNKSASELENRSLLTKDEITLNIKDGGFQSDIETLLSDQFPLREKLVLAQTRLRYCVGQRDINGAYICKNGRLIQKITPSEVDKVAIEGYADKINEVAKTNKVYVMYVPSAEALLSEELPGGAPIYDYDALYSDLSSRLGNARCINLKNALESRDCYYKTDHHWTALGAYNAYAEFCKAKGDKAEPLYSYELKSASKNFQGTLFSKVPFVKTEDEILLPSVGELKVTADGREIGFYDMKALETKDKYNVFQGGNHGIVEIINEKAKNNKSILVLKDSFANSFVPYIVNDYAKITMLDERYTFISLNDYIKQTNPDEILVLREIIN